MPNGLTRSIPSSRAAYAEVRGFDTIADTRPAILPLTCPACGGRLAAWLETQSADLTQDGTFTLWRCDRCGSARTGGEVAPTSYETGTYRPVAPRGNRLIQMVLGAFAREKVRVLRAVAVPGSRVLDVGAGRGRFVLAASSAGYDASGIEPSEQGSATATMAGATVRRAGVEDAQVAEGSIEVVTLWHVLEHIDAPASALSKVGQWLRPGGVLIVAVPQLSSLQARIGGPRWFHLDVPRHRTHFTRRGLKLLLRDAGFEPFFERQLLLEHNLLGMWQTIANRLTREQAYLYNLLKRNAPLNSRDLLLSFAALALTPVAVILETVAMLAGRGGTVVVAARRR